MYNRSISAQPQYMQIYSTDLNVYHYAFGRTTENSSLFGKLIICAEI